MTDYGNFVPVGSDGIGTNPNTSDAFTSALWIEHEKRIADFLEGYKRGIKGWGVIAGNASELNVKNHSNVSDCSVDVEAGACIIDGTMYTESSTVNISLAQANGSLNRWDLIVYNASASNPVARIGTASAIPTIPDMESDDIPLGLVKRLAGDDTIEDGDIEDIREFTPGIRSKQLIAGSVTMSLSQTTIVNDATEYDASANDIWSDVHDWGNVSIPDTNYRSSKYLKIKFTADIKSSNSYVPYARLVVDGIGTCEISGNVSSTYVTKTSESGWLTLDSDGNDQISIKLQYKYYTSSATGTIYTRNHYVYVCADGISYPYVLLTI